MAALLAGIFLAVVGLSSAAFPDGPLYPFDIESLLTCHVENPMAGVEGQPEFIAEDVPRLPFEQIVTQSPHPHVIWLPGESGFRIPPGVPTTSRLITFLGSDYNPVLTSPSIPITPPPRGCELLPSAEGSGGDQKIHVSEAMDPIPFLTNDRSTSPSTPEVRSLRADPTKINTDALNNLNNLAISTTRTFLILEINPVQALCAIHTALCPLNTTWAELPNGYFPKFFSQGTCSNKNCSFPRGKFCEENFTYVAYVTVLRWDCCFDKFGGQIQWACGWRKVQVPLVCDCTCACSEVFP